MKRIVVIALCFSWLGNVAFAQEKGYFGKKTFIEIGANGQLPIFQNIFGQDKGFVEKNGVLNRSYNLVDYTLRGSFSTLTSETFGVGFEAQLRNYFINPQKGEEINRQILNADGTITSQILSARVGMMPVQEVVLMPKIIFSTGSRVPAGLTHEIGMGYSIIRLTNTNPLVEVDSASGFTSQEVSKNFTDQRNTELKGLVVSYGIRMNYPISKSLLFHIGFRYQYASMLGKKDYKDYEYTDNWFSGREIWSRVNQRRQFGVANVGIGLTLCL